MIKQYTIDDGYIKLFRKMLSGKMWNQPRKFSQFEAWVSLLYKVNHHDDQIVHGNIKVEAGEILTSLRKLAGEWGWSIGKVKRFLEEQEDKHNLEHRIEQNYIIIFLPKWSLYCYWGENTEQNTKQDTKQKHSSILVFNNEAKLLFEYWIKQPHLVAHPKLTTKMSIAIKRCLKDYSVDELKDCIENYNTVLGSDNQWYSYLHSFEHFFREGVQKEAPYKKFLPEMDPLMNLAKDKSKVRPSSKVKSNVISSDDYMTSIGEGKKEVKK